MIEIDFYDTEDGKCPLRCSYEWIYQEDAEDTKVRDRAGKEI